MFVTIPDNLRDFSSSRTKRLQTPFQYVVTLVSPPLPTSEYYLGSARAVLGDYALQIASAVQNLYKTSRVKGKVRKKKCSNQKNEGIFSKNLEKP